MFWVLLGLILIAGMLWSICIKINVIVRNNHCKVHVRIALFYQLIRLPLDLKIELSLSDGVVIIPLKGKFLWRMATKPWSKESKRVASFPKWFKLLNLKIYGNIGLQDDSFSAVILCGVLECILKSTAIILLQAHQIAISFRPDFSRDVFRLNLEGIFVFLPLQIIGVLLGDLFLRRRNIKNVASD